MLHLRVLNLLWWKSRLLECQKAKYHSHSSCESEYHTIANTTVELIWITHLLHDLNTFPSNCPILLCDNLSAIFLSQNLVDRGAKHIDIDYHFVREIVSSGNCIRNLFLPNSKWLTFSWNLYQHHYLNHFTVNYIYVRHPFVWWGGGIGDNIGNKTTAKNIFIS